MATAATITASSLRKIGVSDPGETLSSAKSAVGLEGINDMLAQWSSEGLLIYATTQENFTLTSAQSYTIGTGGTFNTTVPIAIESAFTRVSNIDYPCDIITVEEYNEISTKATTGTRPYCIAYRNAKPLGRIYTHPVSTGVLYLENRKLLQNFASSSTVYTLPEEAMLAVKTNLAVLLAPEFGKSVDQNLMEQAVRSKAVLKSLYVSVPKAKFDLPGCGHSNILGNN